MSHVTPEVLDTLMISPRTVKPRTRQTPRLPIIAISGEYTLNESGDRATVDALMDSLPSLTPTIFAKLAAADFIGRLNQRFLLTHTDTWQWRVSTHERDIIRPDGTNLATQVSAVIHYFGFKGGNYHRLIDPVTMYGRTLDTVWPLPGRRIDRVMAWAQALRDFCAANGLDVRPTIGSLGSQLLTDRRFYPGARRKVPASINARTREQLPGNYYLLNVRTGLRRDFTAHYLDQRRAHHYHARTTKFPAADTLYAHGSFAELERVRFKRTFADFYGLYCLDLDPPERGLGFHWLGVKNLQRQFVYSNELWLLDALGYKVTGVRAAWGSHTQDTGIRAYAEWSETQLDLHDDAPWLKPILLATYGVLASKPHYAETIWRLVKQGEPVMLRTGHNQLNGRLVKGKRKLEPRIANVLHRGMIEAATRAESIGLAQWLDLKDHRILSIYADAVIVEHDDDKPLPPLPEPWRPKTLLNHLQFISQQAFVSDNMTKLPGGVGREIRNHSQGSFRHAPRRPKYEAVTGRRIS